MADRKIKWLIYTVLVGLIPACIRILVWVISQNRDLDILNTLDFVIFGLVLHISNINEIEHFHDDEKSWKTIQNGTSIAFISFYSVLFASYLLGEANPGLINGGVIKFLSIGLGLASFALSYNVYHRVSKFDEV